MAARMHRDAQCLSRVCEIVVICLFILSILAKNSLAYISYSRQELLDIGSGTPVIFIDDITEISKTAGQLTPLHRPEEAPDRLGNVNTGEGAEVG